MILAILQTLLMSTMAMASGDKGNGSDTVHCTDENGTTSVQLLDYYQANTEFSRFKSANHGNTLSEINRSVVKTIAKLDPYRAKRLDEYLKLAEVELALLRDNPNAVTKLISFSNVFLPNIDDEGDVTQLDNNCKINQLIYRRKEIFFNESRLLIYKKDFENLTPIQQSMTLAHEFNYDDAIKYGGAINSIEVRKMSGLFYSDYANELNASEYFNYLTNISESKDLKKQFPYLVEFGKNVYQAYFVFSYDIENEKSLKTTYGLYPEGFYTYIPGFPRHNILVPYYTKGKNSWTGQLASMSLSIIYEYEDGFKQGTADLYYHASFKFDKASGKLVLSTTTSIWKDNGQILLAPRRHSKSPVEGRAIFKLVEDRDSVAIERLIRHHVEPDSRSGVTITIDGKKYDSTILETKQIKVKNNKFELSDIQTYDSDRD